MQLSDAQIKRFVLDTGLASRKDIDSAHTLASERSIPFADALRSQGTLTNDDIRRATAYIFGIPFVSLLKKPIDPTVFKNIPEAIARTYHAIPFAEDDVSIEVAMLDVSVFPDISAKIQTKGKRILPRITDEQSLQSALARYQRYLKSEYGELIRRESTALKKKTETDTQETENAKRLLDAIIHHALFHSALTVHLEPSGDSCLVRYRIHTTLHDAMELPAHVMAHVMRYIESLAHLQGRSDIPREGRFRITCDGERISVRARTTPMHTGTYLTLTFSRAGNNLFTIEGLGMHGTLHDELLKIIHDPRASLLIAGDPKSGKTTTLYTLLDTARTPEINAITVETSIEATLPRVGQIVVRYETGFDTSSAIRAALKNDPSIIAIDVDEPITPQLPLLKSARARGMHVMATVINHSACEAWLSLWEENSHAIHNQFTHILGVSTVRVLGDAREKYYLTAQEMTRLREIARMTDVLQLLKEERVIAQNASWSSIPFYRAPLDTSEDTIYTGTTGIHELLTITPELRDPHDGMSDVSTYLSHATRNGMFTLVEDAIIKATMGITTLDEVWRISKEYYGS